MEKLGRYYYYRVLHYADLMLHYLRGKPRPMYTLGECLLIDYEEPALHADPYVSPLALPYSDSELGQFVEDLRDSHWRHEEISMTEDPKHYQQLDEQTKRVLDINLRFFAVGDNLVVENLLQQFARRISLPVVQTFYSYQIANEEEHKLTYARLINTIIDSEEKRMVILDDANEPAIKLLADWISERILDPRSPMSARLLCFVFVEGIIFTSSFAFIYWLRARNTFPGLGKSNEFISRDENLHAMFACSLYSRMRHKLSQENAGKLVDSAMQVCDAFIDAMFNGDEIKLLGMNGVLMKTYVRHVTNYYFVGIGYEPFYREAFNPFPFMMQQSLEGKTNFFESDVSEYKKASDVQATQYSETLDF